MPQHLVVLAQALKQPHFLQGRGTAKGNGGVLDFVAQIVGSLLLGVEHGDLIAQLFQFFRNFGKHNMTPFNGKNPYEI